MLPFSKEIPKEMLPVIVRKREGILVEPVLHFIFDALYDAGFRKYYFVVGRGKRVIEDYFTPDWSYVDYLRSIGKASLARILEAFYRRIEECEIVMINQPYPRGFGDAVLRTRPFMVDDTFLVHAGDDIIYPNHVGSIVALLDHFTRYRPRAVFLYDISRHPERYGVIVGEDMGDYIEVSDVIEKPLRPPSNKVVVAVYMFDKSIYDALEATKPSKGEHQLTDAIRYLLKRGERIHAVRVRGRRLDLGTPEYYFEALKVFVEESVGMEDV
jgi:UTP--glucose-1-phosphate uridylyltransferase